MATTPFLKRLLLIPLFIAALSAVTFAGGRRDAGVDAGTDAGVDASTFSPGPRRVQFLMQVDELAELMSDNTKTRVEATSIFFAHDFSPTGDAAVVLFQSSSNPRPVALFFTFSHGAWAAFPTDFE